MRECEKDWSQTSTLYVRSIPNGARNYCFYYSSSLHSPGKTPRSSFCSLRLPSFLPSTPVVHTPPYMYAHSQMLESPNASLDQPLVLEVEGGARRRGTPAILMGQSANDHQRYSTILASPSVLLQITIRNTALQVKMLNPVPSYEFSACSCSRLSFMSHAMHFYSICLH
jgi:hypothetical protein